MQPLLTTSSVHEFLPVQDGFSADPSTEGQPKLGPGATCRRCPGSEGREQEAKSGRRGAGIAESKVRGLHEEQPYGNASSRGRFRDRAKSRRKRSGSGPCVCPTSATSHNAGAEAVDEQIRKFKERPDLRECCVPGMMSKISREACEGWQRHARTRSSQLIAKVKLEPCKNCRFNLSGPVSVSQDTSLRSSDGVQAGKPTEGNNAGENFPALQVA